MPELQREREAAEHLLQLKIKEHAKQTKHHEASARIIEETEALSGMINHSLLLNSLSSLIHFIFALGFFCT
jgi:hypothetical protein